MKKILILTICNLIFISAFSQWQQVNDGIYGGDTDCLVALGDNLFAGNNGYGVFISADNGENWNEVNNGLTNLNVSSLAVFDTVLFAGTFGGGVFRSTNNGNSWEEINTGLKNLYINTFAASDTNIFVGTNAGVFRTTNYGNSWIETNNGLTDEEFYDNGYDDVYAIAIADTNIYAGTWRSDIFLSSNNGDNWEKITSKLAESWFIASLAIVGDEIFAGTATEGLYQSNNNGKDWTKVYSFPRNFINDIILHNSIIYVATEASGIFRSNDNGKNWTQLNNGLNHTRVQALVNNNNHLFAGTSFGGIYVSGNYGLNWSQKNNGYSAANVTSLKVLGTNVFAGTSGGDVFRSNINDSYWSKVLSIGDYGYTNCLISDFEVSGADLFVAAASQFVSVIISSTTNGDTWTKLTDSPSIHKLFSLAISGEDIFASTFDGIFYSNDNCKSWNDRSFGLTGGVYDDILISGTDIFTAGHNDVFISSDNGISWSFANSGITTPWINAFAVLDTFVFAGTWGKGIFRYSKRNAQWEEVNNGLTSYYIYAFASHGPNLFAGAGEYFGNEEGVFLSTDNGTNWTDVDDDLVKDVTSLTVSGEYIYAATIFDGIWRRPLDDMIITHNTILDQENLSLKIYPNPSKSGIFLMDCAILKNLIVSIYDLNGKLVYEKKILNNGIIPIDLSDKNNGIYSIRILGEGIDKTDKLIIQ